MKQYDFIFTGGGLATLLTLSELVKNKSCAAYSILVIDSEPKNTNDRTWCFWDSKNTFDEICYQNWNQVWFKTEHVENLLSTTPYHYKMIRSKAFYDSIHEMLKTHHNIEFSNEKVLDFFEDSSSCVVKTITNTYTCSKIINSIYRSNWVLSQTHYPLVQQHFIGWFVKTKESVFTKNCATFMDFSVEQKQNTRFMYVLPQSNKEALVEYTLFSENLLPKEEYEQAIEVYLKQLGVTDYEIIEREQGTIPMTCYPFWKNNTKNIIHIGSAGGWTKASTGFTFKNSIKKSKALAKTILEGKDFRKAYKKNRFWFYDLLLIDILFETNQKGKSIFNALFKSKKAALIFKFLDEETTLWEDIKVIWMCPKVLFVKALAKRIAKGF